MVDMEKGDVSLKLRNVKLEDSGRYECYVVRETNRNKRDIQPINTVYLHVAPGECLTRNQETAGSDPEQMMMMRLCRKQLV